MERVLAAHGLRLVVSVEQELRTSPAHPVDFEIKKQAMLREAETDENGLKVLEALSLATETEHLFNIAIYRVMGDDLEFRGTPALHGAGYYDEPGNIEFRVPPSSPQGAIERYERLIRLINEKADEFGLRVLWRGEQVNGSVWRGERNITSIDAGGEADLAAAMLMGVLEANEDARLLSRRYRRSRAESTLGPTRLDHIRIVQQSANPDEHHFEQREVFKYFGNGRVDLQILVILDGVLRGVKRPELGKRAAPIRSLYFGERVGSVIKDAKLDNAWIALNRFEVDAEGRIANIEALFARNDTLFYRGRMGELATRAITGRSDAESEERVKRFFRETTITEKGVAYPASPEFQEFVERLAPIQAKRVLICRSVRFGGRLTPNSMSLASRIHRLRKRWGSGAVNRVLASPQICNAKFNAVLADAENLSM